MSVNKIVLFIKKIIPLLNVVFNKLNYHLVRIENNKSETSGKTLLNIGSGDWYCQGWINLDYPSEWYKKAQSKHKIIPYDIRHDKIPFADNSVDVIYSSHVIEHIENQYVSKLFDECNRVLKPGGIIRISCPDAEFLYQVSKKETGYWSWLYRRHNCQNSYTTVDCLVRELATSRVNDTPEGRRDYTNAFNDMTMEGFFEYIIQGLQYNEKQPGNHINYFTFEKMKSMLNNSGFDFVICSKYMGSCSSEMNNKNSKFDLTYPCMSLYVEAIK